jgi:hypothetical protein
MELYEYWQEVKQRVCMKCIDSDGYGNCLINPSIDCALELYFPRIVEVVSSVKSDSVDVYVQALRKKVCGECRYERDDGTCPLRTEVECALDRYFPLVIQAIEEVDQRTAVR